MADEVKRYLDYDGLAYLVQKLTNRIEAVGGDGKWLPLTGGTLTGDLSVQGEMFTCEDAHVNGAAVVDGNLTLGSVGETADVSEEAGLLVLGVDGRVRFVTLAALSAFLSSPYYARRLVDSLDLPAEAASGMPGSLAATGWTPLDDIVETNGEYSSFECDHPGVTVDSTGSTRLGYVHYVGCTTENASAEDIAFTLRLTYTFDDGSSKTVEVPGRQLAAAHLTVTPSEVTFPADGGSVEVEVDSSSAWEVTGCPDWITCEPTSGAGGVTETLLLTATENPSSAADAASVTLKNEDGVETVIGITQDGRAALKLDSINPESISWGERVDVIVTIDGSVRTLDLEAVPAWYYKTIDGSVRTLDLEAVPAWYYKTNGGGVSGVGSVSCDLGTFTEDTQGVANTNYGNTAQMRMYIYTTAGAADPEGDRAGVRLTAHDDDGNEIGTLDVLVEVDT